MWKFITPSSIGIKEQRLWNFSGNELSVIIWLHVDIVFVALHQTLSRRSLCFFCTGKPRSGYSTPCEAWPGQSRGEGEYHLYWPARHTPFHAPQDTIGLLDHLCTLLTHQMLDGITRREKCCIIAHKDQRGRRKTSWR